MLGLQEDLESSTLKLHDEKEKVADLQEKLSQECARRTVSIFSIFFNFLN